MVLVASTEKQQEEQQQQIDNGADGDWVDDTARQERRPLHLHGITSKPLLRLCTICGLLESMSTSVLVLSNHLIFDAFLLNKIA
jgi:hypothetical protein